MINNEGVPQAADAPINDTNISKHVEPPSKVNKKNKKKAEKASNSETVKVASELLKALIDERPELSLQFRVKAQLIEKKMTQRKLSKAVGLGGSSLSRWLNGLTAKMNTGHLFKINEIMTAWLENRSPNIDESKMNDICPGKGRKICPECKTTTRSNALECKKCKYSFAEIEELKKTQKRMVWPEGLRNPRNESSRRAAEIRMQNKKRKADQIASTDDSIQSNIKTKTKVPAVKAKKKKRKGNMGSFLPATKIVSNFDSFNNSGSNNSSSSSSSSSSGSGSSSTISNRKNNSIQNTINVFKNAEVSLSPIPYMVNSHNYPVQQNVTSFAYASSKHPVTALRKKSPPPPHYFVKNSPNNSKIVGIGVASPTPNISIAPSEIPSPIQHNKSDISSNAHMYNNGSNIPTPITMSNNIETLAMPSQSLSEPLGFTPSVENDLGVAWILWENE